MSKVKFKCTVMPWLDLSFWLCIKRQTDALFQEIFKVHCYHPKYIGNGEGNKFSLRACCLPENVLSLFSHVFNSQNSSERQVLLLPHFTHEEDEARKEDE